MMDCPENGGSTYYNYKSFDRIVLLAICDAKYCFTFADTAGFGNNNNNKPYYSYFPKEEITVKEMKF